MSKKSKFDWAVLGLTVAALLCMAGWYFANADETRSTWYVDVQRNDSLNADLSESEELWPDSLLEGEIIDLNRATAEELQRLPGIGPDRAQAILDYRQQNGPFSSEDELLRVHGIGPGIFGGLRPFVSVE